MNIQRIAFASASLIAFGLLFQPSLPAQLSPAIFAPVVSFSVHDQPRDGLGDTFNALTGLLREQSTREDRAIQEFDLTSLLGQPIAYAEISGTVSVNNAFNNGTRSFDFSLFQGNGVADLSDFEISSVVIGSGSYAPPTDSSFSFTLDATDVVATILASGVSFVGLKCDPTSNPSFPSILDANITLTVTLGTPGQAIPTGVGCGVGAPQLAGNRPRLGTTFDVSLSGIVPATPGVLLLSFGAPFGVPAGPCIVDIDLNNYVEIGAFITDGTGEGMLSFPLPNDPLLVGIQLTLQAVASPTTGPFNLDVTNGLNCFIGN